jgi:hypothetical protein
VAIQSSSSSSSSTAEISDAAATDKMPCVFAKFGNHDLLGEVTHAGTVRADPLLGCSALANADQVKNKIVLMIRGECDFGRKAVVAHAAGAKGVVVMDTAQKPGAPALVMQTAIAAARNLSIPVVSVSFASAEKLKSSLFSGSDGTRDDTSGGTGDGSIISVEITHPDPSGVQNEIYEVVHEFGASGKRSLGLGVSFPAAAVTKVAKSCTLEGVRVGDTLLGMNHRAGSMSPATAFLPVYKWSMPQFLSVLQHIKTQPGGALSLRFFKGPAHNSAQIESVPKNIPVCNLVFRDADSAAVSSAVVELPCTATKLGFLRAVQVSPVLFLLPGSACNTAPEVSSRAGKIVVVADGIWSNCSTLQAATAAQAAGASGLVIVKGLPSMESSEYGYVSLSGIRMPVVTMPQTSLRTLGSLIDGNTNVEAYLNLAPSAESRLKQEQQQAWSRHVAELAELGSDSEEEALLLDDLGQHALRRGALPLAMQHFDKVARLVQLNTVEEIKGGQIAHEVRADPRWQQDTMVPTEDALDEKDEKGEMEEQGETSCDASTSDIASYLDIVVPSCPKDFSALRRCVEAAARHAHGVRRIFVISATPPPIALLSHQQSESLPVPVIWVPENSFPFSPADCRNVLTGSTRCGWYVQQLYKLYSSFLLPPLRTSPQFNKSNPCHLSSAASSGQGMGFVLVLDSDTVLLRPTRFVEISQLSPMESRVAGLYATGSEYHPPYFEHMQRLLPGLAAKAPVQHGEHHVSGIAHHMIFQTEVLRELFRQVEAHHKVPFWRAFLESAAHRSSALASSLTLSGASEYEIYFSFARRYYPSTGTVY